MATVPAFRILVVDDDRDIRGLHTAALTASGFHVDSEADGEAAWSALTRTDYALLITDNKMPRISGLELVEKMRSARMDLPVVLAASPIPAEDLNRCSSLQFAAMLHKPYPIVELLNTVKKLLPRDTETRPSMQMTAVK